MKNDQYDKIKQQFPDAMVLFRVGEFYEAHHEDAIEASKILGITLTKQGDETHLCGFPRHALNSYLQRLVCAGKRVVLCDDICKPVKEKQPAPTAIQLSLFEPQQNQNLLRYRDEVAKEMLVHNFKNGVLSEDAVGYANRLVKRLYGIDLGCDTVAKQ